MYLNVYLKQAAEAIESTAHTVFFDFNWPAGIKRYQNLEPSKCSLFTLKRFCYNTNIQMDTKCMQPFMKN
jgi:hypothetical protein